METQSTSGSQERVILQQDVRMYEERAILAYLDSPYFDYSKVALALEKNPFPVKNDDGDQVGFANIYAQNGKLVAEVTLDYHQPERLSAETRDGVRHWLRMNGTIVLQPSEDPFLDLLGNRQVARLISLEYLVLSTRRPSDRRLLPLGEPV